MFRDKDRRDRYDDRDRRERYRDDDRYGDRRRGGERSVGKPGQPAWQREAMSMFKEYAVPLIKAEGGKFISKQLAGYAKKR